MKKLLLYIFVSLQALAAKPIEPTLINGTVVKKSDYPATIWIGGCTGSLVGQRTALTAAHCVNSSISFTVGSDKYTAKCRVSQKYLSGNSTADWAACYTDRVVVDVPFEIVNTDPAHVAKSQKILQSGYGCTVWGGPVDNQLRVGLAEVLTMPSGTSNDYVTGKGAVLCSGDSGGPAWSVNTDGSRNRLISVNSRSNTVTQSYLVSTSTQMALEFLNAYASEFKAEICGLHASAKGCRNEKTATRVVIDHEVAKTEATLKPGKEAAADDLKAGILEVLNSLK